MKMFQRIAWPAVAMVVAISASLTACDRLQGSDADDTPPLLLISIDGFRHDYLDRVDLPVLRRLAAEGLRADSLMHVFPTKTFATHYALATGLYAEHTGVVANNMWDPLRKSRFSLGNRDAVSDGYWYDGEPIWNTVEKAGKIAATYFWPGSEAQIGGIRPTEWKPYVHETPHDERVDQVLAWLDRPEATRPDFLTLYFSVVDSAGHRYGPGHPETAEAMREVDRALGRLIDGLEQRGLLDRMHVLVTSDHGMAEIAIDRYVLLDADLGLDLGRVNVSDWGPAAQIWTIEDGPSADQIVDRLRQAPAGIRRVWKKGEAPTRYHFDDHRRVPDVTAEAEPGWMLSNRPYFAGMQRGMLNGMHGWEPAWHPMHGLFIAHGPAFSAGDRLPAVRSIDLYSLMAELLDVPPAATDGSLAPFEPLLALETPMRVAERRWSCADGSAFITRHTPGLLALHAGEFVYSLPTAETTVGESTAGDGTAPAIRFAADGIEAVLGECADGACARFRVEGAEHPGCRGTVLP